MARVQRRQEGDLESHASLGVDALPVNGVEDQATRRAHMREQTMARQAAECRFPRLAFEARLQRAG